MKAAHYTKANITSDGTARLANARLSFYCRATHAGAVLATAPCLSVCLSVTSRRSTDTSGRIKLVLARKIPSTLRRSVVLATGPLSLLPRARIYSRRIFRDHDSDRSVATVYPTACQEPKWKLFLNTVVVKLSAKQHGKYSVPAQKIVLKFHFPTAKRSPNIAGEVSRPIGEMRSNSILLPPQIYARSQCVRKINQLS